MTPSSIHLTVSTLITHRVTETIVSPLTGCSAKRTSTLSRSLLTGLSNREGRGRESTEPSICTVGDQQKKKGERDVLQIVDLEKFFLLAYRVRSFCCILGEIIVVLIELVLHVNWSGSQQPPLSSDMLQYHSG